MPIEQVSQVAVRPHVQPLLYPTQGHGRFGPQLGRQAHFKLAAFAMPLEFSVGPALPL